MLNAVCSRRQRAEGRREEGGGKRKKEEGRGQKGEDCCQVV
jgi:hypothetical protein